MVGPTPPRPMEPIYLYIFVVCVINLQEIGRFHSELEGGSGAAQEIQIVRGGTQTGTADTIGGDPRVEETAQRKE